ncbi:hypothetical protein CH267_28215 [Rhodococcus sp. 06-621-2]|nr:MULTISPECIES: hypothetical protein [unclassified Rhodococcus (in: high G+C Gram-positive bacteria)]OZC46337.1 hypothetical protein CH267_28215 [Rhodococcus sp. 06-621-2]OZD64685.1 hypothetical protein CH263_14095 [Rhodococcus sp. 06-1059B-a]
MALVDASTWVLAFVFLATFGAFGMRLALTPTCSHLSRTDVALGAVCTVSALGFCVTYSIVA